LLAEKQAARSIPNTFFSSYSKEIEAKFISTKALGSHFERADCLPILDFGSQRTCNECLRTTRLPNAQTKSTRPRPLWLTKLYGSRAFLVVVGHAVDQRAHGKAPHLPGIEGFHPELRRPLRLPFYNAPCANPIQFLAQHPRSGVDIRGVEKMLWVLAVQMSRFERQ
jgi:hypothetical protein